jgi:hypothetical protein
VPSGFPESFRDLMILRQLHVQTIDNEMGVSPAMNTALPSPEQSVDALQGGRLATLTSINDIYTAAQNLFLRMSKYVLMPMIQDCIEQNKAGFIAALGETVVSEIEMIKQIPLATLGININVGSTEEEKAQLMGWINLDIKNGALTSDDGLDAQRALRQSEKLASGLMKQRKKANQKMAMDMKAQDSQLNAQNQQASTQMASQLKQQEMQMAMKFKQQEMAMELDIWKQKQAILHQDTMEQIAGKNIGLENTANINAGKAVKVQQISTEGKLKEGLIQSNTKVASENIIHHSNIQQGFQEHDHKTEQQNQLHRHNLETIADTPKPTTTKE